MSEAPITESGLYRVLRKSREDDDPKIARIHRLLSGLYIAVALNWLHDLGATVEMFDWLDGRQGGFMSTEFEHELGVMAPFLAMVFVPIVMKWLEVRRRKADSD